MNLSLVSALVRGKWLIEPQFAIGSHGMVNELLSGKMVLSSERPVMKLAYKNGEASDSSVGGMVAMASIKGPLMKDDQECGPMGMVSIGRFIQSADRNPSVDAIVLNIDSPGGTVDGTESLANIIKNTSKPVVAFVDGMMASAALWIGSMADEVWASTDLDEVGSVGVIMSFADMQPMWEKQGVVFHRIVSSLSPDKNKMFEDLKSGKYEEYQKEFMDPIAEKFQSVVRSNRPEVNDSHLTGKIYLARDVMGVFVDRIGTLDQAIDRALELSKSNI